MLEILTLQVIAATLGTLSIGGADWLYHRGRIRQPVHSLWVSSSSTAICLPLLTWTIKVFLGVGVISWVLVGTFGAMMFLWMYRSLLRVPPRTSLLLDQPRCADRTGRSRRRPASTANPRFRGVRTYLSSSALKAEWQSEGEDQQDTQPSNESPTITGIAERTESLS